jgi:F420-0:gamma-glutamyl ligase
MKVEAIKTRLVRAGEISLEDLLSESIKALPENSVVAVSSKVLGLLQNRVVKKNEVNLEDLIMRESEYYLDPNWSPYGYYFTINGRTLISKAGIDESNVDSEYYVLLPEDMFGLAEKIRVLLTKKFARKNLGVIIIDSVSSPLRRGTKGEMLAWSGFAAVKDYVGTPDLFARDFKIEMSGIGVSLAIAANVVMGEGAENQPLAIISEIPFVDFTNRAPTEAEIDVAFVPFNEDIFMPFLKTLPWLKGGDK